MNSSFNESDDQKTAAAAAKRKGSFKKWLRSSHRKFTSNNHNLKSGTSGFAKDNNTLLNTNSKTLNLTSNEELIENLKNKVIVLSSIFLLPPFVGTIQLKTIPDSAIFD